MDKLVSAFDEKASLTARGILHALPVPALIKDSALRYVHANDEFCALSGVYLERLVGSTTAELVPGSHANLVDARDREILEGGGPSITPLDYRRPDGRVLRVRDCKSAILDDDGAIIGVLSIFLPQDHSFRMAEGHDDPLEVYQLVLENISDAVFTIDDEGEFVFICPNADRIFGLTPGQIAARHRIDALLGEGFFGKVTSGQTLGRDNIGCEITDARQQRHALLVNVLPIVSHDAKWLISCRDVTEYQRVTDELNQATTQTVMVLAQALETRDAYVAGHQRRVAQIAVAIGRRLGLDSHRLEGLRLGGMVHDIGKINIPAEILNKPSRLNEHEFAIIKTHPEVGYELLKEVKCQWPIADMVQQHHENMDGSGYPQGLSGEAILLEARILKVADMAEAITSHRPYRPGLGLDKAVAIITAERGTKSDPAVVDAFLDLVRSDELPPDTWQGTSY